MSIGSSSSVNEGTYYYDGGNYSNTETETGKLWIDGNPIYRKVVNIAALPNTTSTTYPHGITTTDTIISCRGMANSGTNELPMPRTGAGGAGWIDIYANSTNITIASGTDLSTWSAFVIMEYTKV